MAGVLCLVESEYSNWMKIVDEGEMFWCFEVCRLRMIARVSKESSKVHEPRSIGGLSRR